MVRRTWGKEEIPIASLIRENGVVEISTGDHPILVKTSKKQGYQLEILNTTRIEGEKYNFTDLTIQTISNDITVCMIEVEKTIR